MSSSTHFELESAGSWFGAGEGAVPLLTSTIFPPFYWPMFKCLMTASPCILLLVWFLHGDSIGSSIDDLLLKLMVLIHRSTITSVPLTVYGSSDIKPVYREKSI
jgi:hypothetical protein